MTDGTLASRRTTGCSTLRIHSGANSTMKTDTNSAVTSPRTIAEPVIRIVLQISGQA